MLVFLVFMGDHPGLYPVFDSRNVQRPVYLCDGINPHDAWLGCAF